VLGERNPRQIRDLFPAAGAGYQSDRQVVLHTDTAYELLRVILVERGCCVAISDRVPPERTPQAFLGPQGELLVYTPPPPDWRFDALDLEETTGDTAEGASEADETTDDDYEAEEVKAAEAPVEDDLTAKQQERLWDGALPLNALQVGDEVVQAQPYHPGVWATATPAAAAASATTPEADAAPDANEHPADHTSYDWLKL
jgi:hypothetical protein